MAKKEDFTEACQLQDVMETDLNEKVKNKMQPNKFLSLIILSIFLITSVSAATFLEASWHDLSQSISINYGETTEFDIYASCANPPLKISTKLYNSGILVHTFQDEIIYDYTGVGYVVINPVYEVNQLIYETAGNFEIRIEYSDAVQGTQNKILNLIVNPAPQPPNNPPVLNSIGDKQVNENEQLQFSISATDADGDTLTYSASNLPTGATFNSNTFIWTPTYTQSGTYHDVKFTVSDGTDSDSETITITVNNVNRAPNIASIPDSTINEGDFYNYNVEASDPDGDDLIYSLTQNLSWLSINPNTGLITGTAPPVISDEEDQVIVRVSDENGGTDTESYILTVNNLEGDTTSPTITIISPEDGKTHTSSIEELHFIVIDENLDFCLVNGNPVSCNSGELTIIEITSVEGTNTWTVYANDTFGNIGNASVTFIVDLPEDSEGDDNGAAHSYKDVDELKYFEQFRKPGSISYSEEIPEPEKETNWLILVLIIGIIVLIIVIALLLINRLR